MEFREGALEVRVKGAKLENSYLFKENHQPPASFKKHLVRLAIALENKEPVLLIGPTSFKSLLLQTWTEITNRNSGCEILYLTSDTKTNELIGQMHPFSYFEILDLIQKNCYFVSSSFSDGQQCC